MLTMQILISQVRQAVIEANDTLLPHELYSRFINECNNLNLSEKELYMQVLKPAYKSINWDQVVKPANKELVREAAMFCDECGTMNEDKGSYCAECGNKLEL